jgi:hypothetical protein
MSACPVVQRKFHRLVNMTPREILAWSKDPRSKCASYDSTRARLPALAKLKGKAGEWTESDCKYAQRVVSFNSRHLGQMKRFGCTERETAALLNWAHRPKCPMPSTSCKPRKR